MTDTNTTIQTATASLGSVQPPSVPRQMFGMLVRYVFAGIAVTLVRKGFLEESVEGPFVDVATGFFVFVFVSLWGLGVKMAQRSHWFDALYASPPSPPPALVVQAAPSVTTDDVARATAALNAASTVGRIPGL